MEIQEIKSSLTLPKLLSHYGLKADKNHRLNCPFHDDKTPSLQLYYKTQTAFCFSSNCKTHGKAIDVIDFIMYKENITKHEAIQKAKEMVQSSGFRSSELTTQNPTQSTQNFPRSNFLEKMFTYFKNGIHSSKPAQEYLQSRGLDFKKTEVGYNAGQFHHGSRRDEQLIAQCVEYGLLLDLGLKARTGDTAYKPFGKWCIVFALRNKENQIVSLYFRSTLADKEQRHFYLKDRQGLYPNYPKANTQKLILTESIIDAATLLEQENIKNNYEILSLYGTNGLSEEHQTAISQLQELEEIIFFLNGDEPGQKAVAKYAQMLKIAYPNLTVTAVEVPQNEDVNSLLQGHSPEIFTHLIDTRKDCNFIFSSEEAERTEIVELPSITEQTKQETAQTEGLDIQNPYNLKYRSDEALYQIKGFRSEQLDSLKITLQISLS
jgi:DNA primase